MFKKFNKMTATEKSRICFILEGITGIGQFSLTTGAFLAGFISLLGASDTINGMIAVVPAITGVLQIFSPLIFERMVKRKRTIVTLAIFLRILLSSVFFLPILVEKYDLGLTTFLIIFSGAYCINAILAPAISSWMVDLTPMEIRGKYLAQREKIALFITAILTIILGKVLDITEFSGHAFRGFIWVGVILVIMGVLNVVGLINAVEPVGKNIYKSYQLKEVVTVPLKDKAFRKIILLNLFWSFALQVGGPFISVYMVNKIELTYTYIMACSVVSTVVRVLFTSYWGKLADQKSWFLSTKLSLLILGVDHFLWGFVNASNYSFMVPLLHILGGLAWGGVGISLFNLQFLFAKREGRTMYLGLNAAIGGAFSYIAVWFGGKIVDLFENHALNLFGFEISSMQMVFMLSGISIFLCPAFVQFFIEKNHPQLEEQ